MSLLSLWMVITLLAVLFHEPWRDELQAWLLARDLSLPELFGQLKYEGHFLPWFLLAKPLAAWGCPIIAQNLLGWTLCLLGIIPVLFFSPFHRITKAAIVFSAPLIYWYPVLSRCYALIPVLLFSIAAAYPNRKEHPWLYGILIALLANTHAYMEGVVLVLFVLACVDLVRAANRAERVKRAVSLFCIGAGALLAFLTVAGIFRAADREYHLPVPDPLLEVPTIFKQFANAGLLQQFQGREFYPNATGTVLAVGFLLLALCLFRRSRLRIVYAAVSAGIVVGGIAWPRLDLIFPGVFLCAGIFLFCGRNWRMIAAWAAATLYQFLFAFLVYGLLPVRGVMGFLDLAFFVWIFPQDNGKPALETPPDSPSFDQRCVILYACFMFFGIGHLMLADFLNPFSGTAECGMFLRDNISPQARIAIYPRDDRLTGISAYLKGKILDFGHDRLITFHPRNTRGDRPMPKTLNAEVLVVRIPGKPPEQIVAGGKELHKIWSTPPCVMSDEFASVYLEKGRADLYLPLREIR